MTFKCAMGFKVFLTFTILLISGGCIFGGPPQPTKTYLSPCSVVSAGVQFKVSNEGLSSEAKASGELSPELIKEPLARVFVDDLFSPTGMQYWKDYKADCYWGYLAGEIKDYYYCKGTYMAPELDEKGVIKRIVNKEFYVGLKVDKNEGTSWVDFSGVTHTEEPYYLLTVGDIKDVKCWV